MHLDSQAGLDYWIPEVDRQGWSKAVGSWLCSFTRQTSGPHTQADAAACGETALPSPGDPGRQGMASGAQRDDTQTATELEGQMVVRWHCPNLYITDQRGALA